MSSEPRIFLVNNAVSFVFGHMAGDGGSGTGTDKEISTRTGNVFGERQRVGLCSYDQVCCTLHEARRRKRVTCLK